jgi:hypothetical protein
MTELKTKALFIGGTKPELAIAAAVNHHVTHIDVDCRTDLNRYWKGHYPFSIQPRYAATHMLPDEIVAKHPTDYDAVYLLEPTPDLVQKVMKLLKPGAWVMDGNGNALQCRDGDGKTPDMDETLRNFIITFGVSRHGDVNWIGPTAQELGVDKLRLINEIKGKTSLKPDSYSVVAATNILDAEIARHEQMKRIRAMLPK